MRRSEMLGFSRARAAAATAVVAFAGLLSPRGVSSGVLPSVASSNETVLAAFPSVDGQSVGASTLSVTPDGVIYGETQGGDLLSGCGSGGCGGVYRLTPGSNGYALDVLYRFKGGADGANPIGGLVADGAGNLFGVVAAGGHGACACGAIFELSPTGSTYRKRLLFSFKDRATGESPFGGLAIDAAGALYGTAGQGSPFPDGVAYKLTPSGASYSYTIIHNFMFSDGSDPRGRPIVDASGRIFGTTMQGGSANAGVVYELVPTSSGYTETTLYSFTGGNDGAYPAAGVVADASGNLYGTATEGGGSSHGCQNCGTVYRLSPAGSAYQESTIYRFNKDELSGCCSSTPLAVGADGSLYGETQNGGFGKGKNECNGRKNDCGTVFRLTPSGSTYIPSDLVLFDGKKDGGVPDAAPVVGLDGAIYGTTLSGGIGGGGVAFRITPVTSAGGVR